MKNIEEIISDLSLEEKAYLLTGKSNWEFRGVERMGIDSIVVTDGPHGIRKSVDPSSKDINATKVEEAVCFPTASALACSFNEDILKEMGEYLGEAGQAMDVRVILGPGNNIKRTPLCGRNFEYFSEDPYLASRLALAEINGIQSKGIGTSLKHFVANNQEFRRQSINAIIDERTLREIYLTAFEEPVIKGKPWTIMGSYNRINGTYAIEHPYLLKNILREEWGYEGLIITDWTAMDRLDVSVKNGMDLEMPGSGDVGPKKLIKAVKKGKLSQDAVDKAAANVVKTVLKAHENSQNIQSYDIEKHHQKAREIANECIVLLKNEEKILPLNKNKSIAVIGKFAIKPRYQGGGSSHISPYKVDTILEQFEKTEYDIKYTDGYTLVTDEIVEEYIKDAVNLAKESDIAILFVGLPDAYETEGIDRTHIKMPPSHIELINKVSDVNENIVIVLSAGSVVDIPSYKAKGIIFAGLLGEAGAGPVVDVLTGIVNPSGKLSESFIKDLKDDPSYNSPSNEHEVRYEEGIFVGYRFHDKMQSDLQYEFGYGLSYTNFEYSSLKIEKKEINDTDNVKVALTVKNSGDYDGKEIVQLYVSETNPLVERPLKELKGFKKIFLKKGESKIVEFELNKRSFAYYNVDIKDWHVNSGEFKILIGKSSQNIILQDTIKINSNNPLQEVTQDKIFRGSVDFPETNKIHRNTPLIKVKDHVVGSIVYKIILKEVKKTLEIDDTNMDEKEKEMLNPQMMSEVADNMPLRSFVNATAGDAMSDTTLSFLIFILNLTRPDKILGKFLNLFRRKKN